ncbi:MAG: alanine--tRNA ligase [Bdellovibrionota bacterium]
MKSREVRQTFIDYFKKQGHRHVASSSLVPENDATLLFANAGMNQFKNLFLGLEQRDYNRAVTSQKCVRAGGKHNDLENVGHTARHHTFFEMLGNFSFGDYFKKDAIHMAWELLTKELGIPKEKLYVTVFTTDDEAADIWHKQEGVAKDRIYRFGEKDNFWRMGDVGPCGPCSEIFYDHGPDADDPFNPSTMGGDGDRYVEIWNNVFMQYNEDANGKHPLPKPSVDTGGGLERWAAVLQGTHNNFNTDAFMPIIEQSAKVAKIDLHKLLELEKLARQTRDVKVKGEDRKEVLQNLAALRVLADHARATAFLMADGVLPSNEGRGYVLRRMMRRAIRYGRKMSDDQALFPITVQKVIAEMHDVYPELKRGKDLITTSVNDEVTRFLTTLDQGTEILNGELAKLEAKKGKVLDGAVVFKLYDTYGFPVDLTRLMAEERGLTVDEEIFMKNMEEARSKAKSSSKFKALSADAAHLVKLAQETLDKKGPTKFAGYTTTRATGNVVLLSNGFEMRTELKAGEQGLVVFDTTTFYGEGGGQVGDHGVIESGSGAHLEVVDTTKTNDVHLHHVRVIDGTLKVGDSCTVQVTDSKRRSTAANHSATHLLHSALRSTLGKHVTQAGSLVDPERLRFDYTHNKPLTDEEISRIETLVNEEISKQIDVNSAEMEHQAAIEAGALALFGEKYGDRVRVIKMGEFSTELCGGTHVTNTAMIRSFKIVSDSGVASGVRRIEALTGDAAFEYMLKNTRENQHARSAAGYQASWTAYLNPEAQSATVSEWIEHAKMQIKTLEKEIKKMKGSAIDVDALIKDAKAFGSGAKLVTASVDLDDRELLSDLSAKIKDKIKSGVVVLVGKGEGRHPIVVAVTQDLLKTYQAGKLLGEIAQELGGKGGGRPDFATGAGENLAKLPEAFKKAATLVGV